MSLGLLIFFLASGAQAAAQPGAAADGGKTVVGAVVRSKQWVIRRSPQREEEFVGDVSYRKGPSLFNSDWALFRHESQVWRARGRVRLRHELKSGDRIEVSGDQAEYGQKTGRGRLQGAAGGPVSYERTPLEGPPDSGSARSLEWEGQDHVRLAGQVHVWGPRLEVWGDLADFDGALGGLTVTGGRPVLRTFQGDWTGAVQADSLTAKDKPERLWADGRTRGWIQFREKLEKLVK